MSAVLVNDDTDLYDLTIRAGGRASVIHTTWKHPFWDVTQHRWVKAGQLRPGDHLRTAAGGTATVIAGTTPRSHDGRMWDLTVPGPHDFYVQLAVSAVLVHNCINVEPGPAPDGSTLEQYANANRGSNQRHYARFCDGKTSSRVLRSRTH